MTGIHTVADLVAVLKAVPQDLPIAMHVNNHTYIGKADRFSHGTVRVALMNTYVGDHVLIGNFSLMDFTERDRHIERIVNGEETAEAGGKE